ncbi:ATP-binding protein [Saccharothrix sp. HUAS TT1]|uniref:ATP-binding protein n=1 Tax=unclassified Saccharothrix TaxID=2593673 RepID=UPI00345C3243
MSVVSGTNAPTPSKPDNTATASIPADSSPPSSPASTAGTRLRRLQVYNWGTFHRKVWSLDMDGGNCLLTGNVGAGKSTIVDALTSLLCPPHRVTFNQAAGATRSERTLTSYALGQYRNVVDETTGIQRPEFLRAHTGTMSVVLATFDRHRSGHVSAGLVLTFKDSASAPTKTYFTAPLELDVREHLLGHGNLRSLRQALRAAGAAPHEDNFAAYQRDLCRLLNVSSGGLALFAQTVSMKQVGNLTDFVRAHMLDAADMSGSIEHMLSHYEDLTVAHDRVVDAREQLDALNKVAEEAIRYERTRLRIEIAEQVSAAVPQHVDNLRYKLLTEVVGEAERLLPGLRSAVTRTERAREAAARRQLQLNVQLNAAGGSQLDAAERDVVEARTKVKTVARAYGELKDLARRAGVEAPHDVGDFGQFRSDVAAVRASLAEQAKDLKEDQFNAYHAVKVARDELTALDAELKAARERPSNIPPDSAALRDAMCAELGLNSEELVFAGEMLTVAEDEREWEAAAERLVRPFALSLLVPDQHYRRVASWVDSHHLGRRLVYYRVDTDAPAGQQPNARSMAAKLRVRPGTQFTRWVAWQITSRYGHVCVHDVSELEHHPRAVTRAGQIRDGARHEKDDRQRADDRRYYVLGWDTAARRARLAELRPHLVQNLARAEEAANLVNQRGGQLSEREYAARMLDEKFTVAADIDQVAAREALRQIEEHRDSLANSPEIAELREHLAQVERELRTLGDELEGRKKAVWQRESALDQATTRLASIAVAELELSDAVRSTWEDVLASVGQVPHEVSACDAWERALNDELRRRTTSASETLARIGRDLAAAMGEYASGWPQICTDIDPRDLENRHRLLEIRTRLVEDDLPRWEENFKEQLERNAIQEIAVFHRKLETEARKISDRLQIINDALGRIDYRAGTYIHLVPDPSPDPVIRQFRADLRDITAGAIGADDDTYSEERFLRVRALLDRFTGREGATTQDRTWVSKVTDVRQWFTFAAAERTRDENALVEHYADSGGKSGGQKEKLAYTILAASLAYQYGLAEGRDDAFRLVMIDEAFGRGSDASTTFGLELFTSLGLQMLVVTPLQKVHTIEPYVSAVGFVRSHDERTSSVISLSITDWRHTRETGRVHRTGIHGGQDSGVRGDDGPTLVPSAG